jgi:DNA-binding IclR family transcriptional regulator
VLTISRGVGHTVVITQGATGKAILACLPANQQKEFLEQLSKSQRTRLEDEIARARRTGFATSKGEVFVGAVAVAAPYFDHRGQVVGSVGLYGPDARITSHKIERFGALVADAARDVSRLLGFEGPEKRRS